MALRLADPFTRYGGVGSVVPIGTYAGSPPVLANVGRDGKIGASWNKNALSFPLVANAFRMGMALRLLDGSTSTIFLRDAGAGVSSTLTPKNWLMGYAWNGFAYCGLVVTNDGAAHFIRGSAFDNGPNSQDVGLLTSTGSGVIPFTGISILEFYAIIGVAGYMELKVNGEVVLTYTGCNKPLGDYCTYVLRQPACPEVSDLLWPNQASEILFGGPTRGTAYAGNVGWVGHLDMIWAFDTLGTHTGADRDLRVDDLLPDSTISAESTIVGSAPTRHEAIEDVLQPDGDTSAVRFDDATPRRDVYGIANHLLTPPSIVGVNGVAYARRGPFGSAQLQLGVSDGVDTIDGGAQRVRSSTYRAYRTAFPTAPGGGEWTLDDVNALRLRVARLT